MSCSWSKDSSACCRTGSQTARVTSSTPNPSLAPTGAPSHRQSVLPGLLGPGPVHFQPRVPTHWSAVCSVTTPCFYGLRGLHLSALLLSSPSSLSSEQLILQFPVNATFSKSLPDPLSEVAPITLDHGTWFILFPALIATGHHLLITHRPQDSRCPVCLAHPNTENHSRTTAVAQ